VISKEVLRLIKTTSKVKSSSYKQYIYSMVFKH
jgi:hypothetical protein